MKIKVISCEIFQWLVEKYMQENMDVVYLEVAKHEYPKLLNQNLQEEINASQEYDAILLLYGLCGNAIIDLKSTNTDLYVFRCHDCSAVLLGSHDKQLNRPWSCFSLCQKRATGYFDLTFEEYQERYHEHAQYLWNLLHQDTLVYINFHQEEDKIALKQLEAQGKVIEDKIDGDESVVEKMLNLEEHPLIFKVDKDKRIKNVYDLNEIIRSES